MARGLSRSLAALLVAALAWVPWAAAQQQPFSAPARLQSPILTVEPERLFAESAFGRRVTEELERQGADLAAENRRIETELTDEEQRLTEQRETLAPDEFRALADAFDEKVQRIRREQDGKARMLSLRNEEARRAFLAAAQPVLERLMREAGAAVILERGSIFMSAEVIDVTDQAIARIDAEIGDGLSADDPAAPSLPEAPPPGDTAETPSAPGADGDGD